MTQQRTTESSAEHDAIDDATLPTHVLGLGVALEALTQRLIAKGILTREDEDAMHAFVAELVDALPVGTEHKAAITTSALWPSGVICDRTDDAHERQGA